MRIQLNSQRRSMKETCVLKYGLLLGLAGLSLGALRSSAVEPPCGIENWTASQAASRLLRAIEFGNGRFLAIGDEGVRLVSSDGLFIGVGGDRIFRSLDGTNWNVDVAPNGWRLTAIVFGAGSFTAVGIGGIIVRSSDGTNWTAQASPTTND